MRYFGLRIIKLVIIILLLINLTGCALLGTILQLAPLATIFVYYSAPSEVEDGKLLCFKTVESYKAGGGKDAQSAERVKSEYYLCLLDYEKGEVRELAKILNDKPYSLEDGVIYYEKDEGKILFALSEPEGTWQLNVDGSALEKISEEKMVPAGVICSEGRYVYLPPPYFTNDISRLNP